MRRYLFLFIIICSVFLINTISYTANECSGGTENMAFPDAVGYGRCAVGWRGGTIIYIDNLNDSGAGSLRQCLEVDSGPRVCIPRVSGYVNLTSILDIENSNVYLVGQVAPGQFGVKGGMIRIGNSFQPTNVLLRYFRTRLGVNGSHADDSIKLKRGTDIMIDHLSVSWGNDQSASSFASGGVLSDITIQNSIIAEPLDCQSPPINDPVCGTDYVWLQGGTITSTNQTFYRNFMSRGHGRFPEAQRGDISFTENVMTNWRSSSPANMNANRGVELRVNWVRNFWKAGNISINNSTQAKGVRVQVQPNAVRLYFDDNWHSHLCSGLCSPESDFCHSCTAATEIRQEDNADSPFGTEPAIPVATAVAACETIIAAQGVGASRYIDGKGRWVAARDAADQRMLDDLQGCNTTTMGTPSSLVVQESDVGGYPTLISNTAWSDTDNDGMSDTWEALECPGGDCSPWGDDALLRCPNSANNGWSNAEEFWNGTCPYNKRKKTGFILQ